ncbi:MFS transporter, partial [candidate division WOR-3 bacterium]|nr:MFS transporter [candidate division WOR-3 bacterium]
MHDAHQPTMTTSSVSPSGFSLYLFGCTLIAALGGLLFGFDTAVISGTTDALRSVYGLSDNLLGFTVASALIGTIMGSLGAGWPADALGRRGTLAWLGVLYFVSAVGCALAWDWWSFLFFRWLGGLAVGGASVVSPLYTAEISPARYRGRMVAITQFNVVPHDRRRRRLDGLRFLRPVYGRANRLGTDDHARDQGHFPGAKSGRTGHRVGSCLTSRWTRIGETMMTTNDTRIDTGRASDILRLGTTVLTTVLSSAVLLLSSFGADAAEAPRDTSLVDKTLVVWVSPANPTQSGGTALTVNDTTIDRFDGVVFAELQPQVWMPGSNGYSRTEKTQADWPRETAGPDELVHLAIVYQGRQITVYRNGEVYAAYASPGEPYPFGGNTAVLFGPRHLNPGVGCFFGRIRDARVYARPLDRETIAAMQPGKPVPQIEPWAWWDFAATGTYDRAGRFNQIKLSGGARIEDGCLVLEGDRRAMLATFVRDDARTAEIPARWSRHDPVPASVVQSTRMFREKLLDDPYRPRYHFCVPEDMGVPGDPNGCFYARGRYHLMYLYNRNGVGFCWGHISSQDLVHWRHHLDAIGPGDGDEGCFSGGAFVDDDGTAYLSYWMLWGDKGIGLARSTDRRYERWQKLDANPVIKSTEWGITETTGADGNRLIYGSSDPSNIWRKDGKYYVLTGNLLVLNKYGRKPDSPESMQGD